MFISLQPDVRLRWGLDQIVAFFNGQVIKIEKSKLNIADMWLTPLDRVTFLKECLSKMIWSGPKWAKIVENGQFLPAKNEKLPIKWWTWWVLAKALFWKFTCLIQWNLFNTKSVGPCGCFQVKAYRTNARGMNITLCYQRFCIEWQVFRFLKGQITRL